MKRLRAHQRDHFARRAAYELRRRRFPRPYVRHDETPEVVTIPFVGRLDLIGDPEETRRQLSRLVAFLNSSSPRRRELFVDLEPVVGIEPCALLYLVALVDQIATRFHEKVIIRGKYPRDPATKDALLDVKFQDFMRYRNRGTKIPRGSRTLYLRRGGTGVALDPEYWGALPDFLRNHGNVSDEVADAFYNAFGEMVENVTLHAYGTASGFWYGVAVAPKAGQPARAVVLDLGVGIPRTIRKEPQDRLRSFLAMFASGFKKLLSELGYADEEDDDGLAALLRRVESDDWSCILLATLGLRTHTTESGRGTGLRWMRETLMELGRGALHVLSGSGHVTWTCGVEPVPAKLTSLPGTAVCLEL